MDSRNGAVSPGTGRLRRFLSGHNRLRLMLTLELAVMLPAALLIYVNYHQLESIKRNKVLEAATHRDFQQMLAISEKQINLKAYTIVDQIREDFPSPDADKKALVCQLDAVLAKYPSLAHVFLFDGERTGLNGEKTTLILRTRPEDLADPYVSYEHERVTKMLKGWFDFEGKMMLESLRKRSNPTGWYFEMAKRSGGPAYMTTAYFVLPNAPKARMALGGVSFEPGYLKDTFFPNMLETLITKKLNEESGNPLAMVVYPVNSETDLGSAMSGWYSKEPLAASAGWSDGKPEVSRNLDDVFRGLALGIKYQGKTVEAIGRSWVNYNLIVLGVLSLLLVGGLFLTHRSVSKEVALARLKSDFVSNVSHELRTPLSLIRLYAETLELGRIKTQDKVEEYYRIIRKESERLTALINNILDFSRIEAGRTKYDFRKTDLAELVTNTIDNYRDQIDEQGFAFEQNIEPGIPPIDVDREAIARSLVNLVNNALKYSDRDKFIGVKLFRHDDALKLQVVDRGIGIARSEQSKIFEKFYRAGDPLVHNTKGSGLGLSLVRHIAHAHGGEIDVDSTPGKGSTFTLTLPLEHAAAQAEGGAELRAAG